MNFWDVHGLLFLIAATFITRLTMLFAVLVPFGLLVVPESYVRTAAE